MGNPSVVRRVLLNVAAATVSLGFALFVAEAAVRIFAPQQLIVPRSDMYVAADSLGWKHRPLVNTTVNTGERTVTFRTDSSGFRVARSGRRDTPRRVLLIGDSFMAALQVEYEQSLAGLLDASLAKLDVPASIDNAGVAGWDPPQYLIQLRRSLAARRYDLVVVCSFVGNDVVSRFTRRIPSRQPEEVHALRWPRSASPREIVYAWLYPINDFLKRRSHLYVLAKKQLRFARMRAGLTAEEPPRELLRRDSLAGRWDTTLVIFKEMASVAEANRVPIRFFLIPSAYQVDSTELYTLLKGFKVQPSEIDVNQPNRLMGSRLAGAGLQFTDLTDALRAGHQSGERMNGAVDAHFSPEGHKVVAGVVLPQIVALLSSESCPSVQQGRRDCPPESPTRDARHRAPAANPKLGQRR
jgi:lysophospholipase L1-like esterase